MADTYTTNLNLTKPEPGAAEDTWGISLNSDLDTLDAIFSSSGTQVNLNPNQVNFADGKKAIFGTGSDLSIYHDGSNSYISEVGTGNLIIEGSSQLKLTGPAGDYFMGQNNGSAYLYHAGSLKAYTTSTGIDVTGTVTADGLTIDGTTFNFNKTTSGLGGIYFNDASNNGSAVLSTGSNAQALRLWTDRTDASNFGYLEVVDGASAKRLLLVDDSGDISFYDDTGTTQGLFWDASTERLGIGTTSPSTPLDVTGDITLTGNVFTDGGFYGTRVWNEDATSLRFATNNTEVARFDSSGNLGIGTDSPSQTLDVAGNIGIRGGDHQISFYANSPTGYRLYRNGTTMVLRSDGSINMDAGANFFVKTANVERIRINSSGDIGIGTTSPSEKLDVDGSINIGDGGLILETTSSGFPSTGLVHYSNNFLYEIGGSQGIIFKDASNTNELARFQPTLLTFSTSNTERARIDSSGNVGIGTTTAGTLHGASYGTTKLHVDGGTNRGQMILEGDTLASIVMSDNGATANSRVFLTQVNDGLMHFKSVNDDGTSKATIMSMTSAGNVGIGTDSPSSALDVVGNIRTSNGSGTVYNQFANAGNDVIWENRQNGNIIIRSDNSNERMRIDTSGRVGIGTSSPARTLDVNGEAVINGVSFTTSGATRAISTHSNAGQLQLNGGTSSSGGAYINIAGDSYSSGDFISLRASNIYTTNANVGIGTNSPSYLLDVESSSTGNITLAQFKTNESTYNGLLIAANNNAGWIGNGTLVADEGILFQDTSSAMRFYTASTERMRIDASGNVGIGTDSPSQKLHVQGSAPNVLIYSNTTSGGTLDFVDQTWQSQITGTGGNLIFKSGGTTERARIDSSGNLLVGTTNTTWNSAEGLRYFNGDALIVTRTSDAPLFLNRLSTDGEILNFNKDGTSVGSIGSSFGNRLYIGDGDTAIRFADDLDTIVPWNGSTNALRDAAIDLGESTGRFKDLHLSGTAYIGTQLGLGTTNPGATLDVTNGSGQAGIDVDSFTGNNSYISFKENGTSRFSINHDTSGNALTIYNSYGSSEAARIDSSGNLLVGKTSTSLTVAGIALRDSGLGQFTRDSNPVFELNRETNTGTLVDIRQDGTTVGSISVSASATAYNTSSDARLKDVTGKARGLEVITKLNPVAYNWKADGKADEGLIAQEVKEIVPNAVSGSEDEHYQMDYSKLVTHLVAGMKEQQEQIESLKSEIAKLKGE